MYYLVAILLIVGWIQAAIIRNFESSKSPISNKYLNHGTLIELIWTITPALILVLIAFPSFKLLYLMDEVTNPLLSVLAEGHQWYWSYEYPDFLNSDGDFVEFDSYLVPESDLEKGGLRLLEVDNRVIIPEITHTRFILTAADVIHSFAIPALGIKCDAYPGRLNQFSVLINRLGTFYGQCSEICGILHSSMPIVVESVSIVKFVSWLLEQSPMILIFRVGILKSYKIQSIFFYVNKKISSFFVSFRRNLLKKIIVCLCLVLFVLIVIMLIQDIFTPISCHGPHPDPSVYKMIEKCSHDSWKCIQPKEYVRLRVHLCDYLIKENSYVTEAVYHEAYSSELEKIYKCKGCPAYLCQDCYKLYMDSKRS